MKTAEDVWIDLYMVAPPEEESLKGKRTVNGFSASFFAGGRDDRLDSNPVEVKLDRPKGTVARGEGGRRLRGEADGVRV